MQVSYLGVHFFFNSQILDLGNQLKKIQNITKKKKQLEMNKSKFNFDSNLDS